MIEYNVVFYLLVLFVVLGGGILDTRYLNVSNIVFNIALLTPFLILKFKIEGASYYINKNYNINELKDLLHTRGNLSESEINKYVRKIDILNDIDEDGVDMVVENITDLAKKSYSQKEIQLILKRVDVNNFVKSLGLFNLEVDPYKINTIINRTLDNLKCY
jgi:hypothetical protein